VRVPLARAANTDTMAAGMMPYLVLFDIDGTLLRPCGLGRRSLERTFGERYGQPRAFDGVSFHGRTDFEIVGEALAKVGAPSDHLHPVLECYLGHLDREVAQGPSLTLPGVPELMAALAERADVVLGLVTGNVRRGAEIKLARDGLMRFFRHGAFGDDSTDRGELVRLARRRAESAGHGPFGAGRCVHVGDTVSDILAAKAAGARAVAVTTGPLDRAALEGHGPDHLFESLAPASRFLAEVLA
jgi:phosphoglycolate phosphatase-like HAD superfamily hydrolase